MSDKFDFKAFLDYWREKISKPDLTPRTYFLVKEKEKRED